MDARYGELRARVDAFVARVEARHAAELRCGPGCDACCRQRLTITATEAAAIVAWAAEQPAEAREAIAAAARASIPVRPERGSDPPGTTAAEACAALDDAGRCRIYPARPLVCRSHGVPIRLRDPRGLPVVTACELNFTAAGPAAADRDCVLDQELVSTTLGLIDRGRGPRVDLAAVLAGLATS